MRRVPVVTEEIVRFASHGVTAHQPAASPGRLFETCGPASMVVLTMTAGGVIGRHPAVGPQLLAVAAGEVNVVGDGESAEMRPGECLMFADGEQHETTAQTDAVLAIMQWTEPDAADQR